MAKPKTKQIRAIPKLKLRPIDGHKGTFGKVAIIAGSVGMSGAAALAGKAALRSGAGLVRIATAKSALPIVASIYPSYTTIPLPEDNQGRISQKAINTILDAVEDNDCLAIGPGLGLSNQLQMVLYTLITQENLKLIIDGDGLNNLSRIKDWPKKLKADIVLTPHPGEFQRLWEGLSRKKIPAERKKQAVELAKLTRTIVTLKGASTVVTDSQKVYVNKTGNPGMATAGSGDILTGVITALIGQGLSSFDATVLGVYIHGLAGDIAAKKVGQISLTSNDIIEALPEAFMKNK
ncbi:MAG: NAD(P)H-hydrate dehydratase [Planctomycetota bacterium]|jgi:NAD(P)H-hydrate epimerase